MINICHIVSGDLWAGAEAMVYSLLNGLKSFPDVRLKVVLLNDGVLSQKLRRAGFDVTVLDEARHGPVGLYQGVMHVLKTFRPAVIHSHRYKENFLAFMAAKRLRGTALVATQHGLIEKYQAFSNLKQQLINRANVALLFRGFQKVVAVSHQMKSALDADNGLRGNNIAVIHNGIPIPIPAESATAEKDTLIVGSCGRLVPVKDYPLMVEVARLTLGQSRAVKFRIAGDGPQKQELGDLIRHHHLDDTFELLGHVDDMTTFYKSIDVFMNTSIHEGIPMSVLEAMSHGRPVVVPDVGGLPEILRDADQGYLITGRHPEAYAACCLKLLRQPDLRIRMGASARLRIEEAFSMQSMARQYYRLYRQLS